MVYTAMEMVFMFSQEVAFYIHIFIYLYGSYDFLFEFGLGDFALGLLLEVIPAGLYSCFDWGFVFWHGFKCIRVVLDSGLLYGSAYLYFGDRKSVV